MKSFWMLLINFQIDSSSPTEPHFITDLHVRTLEKSRVKLNIAHR